MSLSLNEFFTLMYQSLGWDLHESRRELNEEQKKAVAHKNGPLWLLAGPGSGKTEVLVWRVLKLILVDDVHPKSILITTFTEKASKNMLNRIILYFNKTKKRDIANLKDVDISGLRIGTLHSLCNNILAEKRFENFQAKRLMDDDETSFFFYKNVKMTIRGRSGPSSDFWKYFFQREPYNKWNRIERSKSLLFRITEDLVDIEKLLKSENEHLISLTKYYQQYQNSLDNNDKCDFASIQKLFLRFLGSKEGDDFVNGDLKRDLYPIDHVLVDEYQDTNPIQEEIYFRLVEKRKTKNINLTVVGDDDQALYRFRGATVDSLINFKEEVKKRFAKNVTKIQLKNNYRSHEKIIDWINEYIMNIPDMQIEGARAENKEPIEATLSFSQDWNPLKIITARKTNEVAKKVAKLVYELVNGDSNNNKSIVTNPSQIAILAYSTRESKKFVGPYVDELQKLGIQVFNPRNRRIHQSVEIKQLIGAFVDIIDANRCEINIDDNTFRVSAQVRKFIQSCRNELHDLIESDVKTEMLENYINSSRNKLKMSDSGHVFDTIFHRVFLRLINCPPFSEYIEDPVIGPRFGMISSQMEGFCVIYQDYIKKSQSLEDSIDINQTREFYNVFCGQIISKGLNDFEDKDITISPNKVQIMTYHQSKGLEFPFVILLNLRNQPRISICHELESLFEPYRDKKRKTPSKQIRAIQDQIRLYYVGQSRAKYGLIFADTNISEWDYSLGYDWEGAYRNDIEWLEKRGVNLD